MSRPDIIRVILADDHLVVRAGLKALLSTSKDIEVVGEASNGRDAVALVERLSPHVAVLDLDMPQMDGLAATKELVAKGGRDARAHPHDAHGGRVPRQPARGRRGGLPREERGGPRARRRGARRRRGRQLRAGERRARARASGRRGAASTPTSARSTSQLTERERDVLVHVAGGYSASEIGEKLFISPKTVETYKQRITEKLGLSHRSDYVQFCLRLGLLKTV